MIRIGPAGIPLSSRAKTLIDGLRDVKKVGLNAMELQLLHGNVYIDNPDMFVELGELAKQLDIEMGVHAPYYTELAYPKNSPVTKKNLDVIKDDAIVSDFLDASYIALHIGPYQQSQIKKSMENAIANVRELRNFFLDERIKPKLLLENSGRKDVLGSVREVLTICENVHYTYPLLNFGHMHSRSNGELQTTEDFMQLLTMVDETVDMETFYIHFSGVEYRNGDEKHYVPIKRSSINFEGLATAIVEMDLDVTIISDSPLLEHDAKYMETVFEKVLKKTRSEDLMKENIIAKMKKESQDDEIESDENS